MNITQYLSCYLFNMIKPYLPYHIVVVKQSKTSEEKQIFSIDDIVEKTLYSC